MNTAHHSAEPDLHNNRWFGSLRRKKANRKVKFSNEVNLTSDNYGDNSGNEADVLIMARSSPICYTALVADGTKIFEPYGPLIGDWQLRAPDGLFEGAAFERQLFPLMDARKLAV